MAYPQVLIPPSVRPVSPLELTLQDDLTVPFTPRFSRGTTQRQVWGDPVWAAQVRFEGLSGADRALLKRAIMGARGGASNILMTPGIPLRGSFPATELFTNNDFSNGNTGWDAGAPQVEVTAQDRVLRLTAIQGAPYQQVYESVSLTQYAPYALRTFIRDGHAGVVGLQGGPALALGNSQASAYSSERGYRIESGVNDSAIAQNEFPLVISSTTGFKAGDFWECHWCSLARCILADSGPNALTQSNGFENTSPWTRNGVTNVTSGGTAPDGTATSRSLIEDSTGPGSHYIAQTVTVPAAAADYTFSVYLKAATRSYGYIQISDGTTAVYSYLDLTDGSWDSEVVGAGWSNLRKHVEVMGDDWFRFTLTARKTGSSTSLTVYIGLAAAANNGTYTGDGASYIEAWGATLAQSSVPVRYVATTTAATSGTSQSGSTIYVKGLPVSTLGLLLPGDYAEVNGELMQAVAALNSDAGGGLAGGAGLGVLQMNRAPMTPITDNIPIIVNNPFGRFRLASDPRIVERFGVYTDVDLQLIEATA